jgi:hypothetical protein
MMDSHWADSQTYVRVFDAKSSDNKSENDSQRICLHMVAAIELAWNALLSKAFPEDQGYLGTLPPAVRGMIDRRMAEAKARGEEGPLLGDVQHMAGTPLEVGEGMGEALPMRTPRGAYRRVARDISPIQELSPQMMGHRVMARKPTLPMGETVSGMGLTPEQEAGMFIEPQTAMANLPMYEAAPEQSFFTPREQFLAREGATDAARRQVRGSGGGRFQQIRAGTIGGKRTDMRAQPKVWQQVHDWEPVVNSLLRQKRNHQWLKDLRLWLPKPILISPSSRPRKRKRRKSQQLLETKLLKPQAGQ